MTTASCPGTYDHSRMALPTIVAVSVSAFLYGAGAVRFLPTESRPRTHEVAPGYGTTRSIRAFRCSNMHSAESGVSQLVISTGMAFVPSMSPPDSSS